MVSPVRHVVRIQQGVLEDILAGLITIQPLFCEKCEEFVGVVHFSLGEVYYDIEVTKDGVYGDPFIYHCGDHYCWFECDLAKTITIDYEIISE